MLHVLVLLLFAADSKQADTLLRSALLELQQHRPADARQKLEAASRIDSGNPLIWAALAQACWRLNDRPCAQSAAGSAERFAKNNDAALHLLAIFHRETGDLKRAAGFERLYASARSGDASALSRAVSLSVEAGEPQLVLPLVEQAVQRNASAPNRNLLGRVQVAAGQLEEGIPNLSATFAADPQSEQFCFDYAQALLVRGDFGGSADALDQGLRAHPRSAQLQLALGVARYGQRRFEDAIDAFVKTIKLDPTVEQPYVFLGRILDQSGDRLAEITSLYRAWNQSQSANYRSSLLLAKALAAGGADTGEIETLLRRSIQQNADFWESHFELGVVLAKQRKFAEAARELARSAELNPKEAVPHYHLARVFDRLGEPDKARRERELHERLSAAQGGASGTPEGMAALK